MEFSGGLELLVKEKKRSIDLDLPRDTESVEQLLPIIRDQYIDIKRQDLFMKGDTVRPGILVLINDSDWEVEGGASYKLNNKDTIGFISTLHGG